MCCMGDGLKVPSIVKMRGELYVQRMSATSQSNLEGLFGIW